MRIGQLASAAGVSVRALRYYEEQGLLSPARTDGGQRVYSAEHVEQVARIRELLGAGFCTSVIADLLPGLVRPRASAGQLRGALLRARARLESERDAIEAELHALATLWSRWGLDPDVHVRVEDRFHEPEPAPTAPPDHRDRRLR